MADIAQTLIAIAQSDLLCTDLHIAPDRPIMCRTPQGYRPVTKDATSTEDINAFLALPGVAGKDWRKRAAAGEFRTAITTSSARLRINVLSKDGRAQTDCVVIRKLPIEVPSMKQLGLPPAIEKIAAARKGLFLITGATGSGKTTTLASILNYINTTRPAHILTIERPIEYVLTPAQSVITQREVPENTPSFLVGVEAALQHDPDVIAIGEVLDRETMDALLRAANTGHLVLATMHTTSCVDTIARIASFFGGTSEDLPQKLALIANTLTGVITQALLPNSDGKSLVLAYELMTMTLPIAQMIRENKMHQIKNLIDHNPAGAGDMVTLNKTLRALLGSGKITQDAARHASYDLEDLLQARAR